MFGFSASFTIFLFIAVIVGWRGGWAAGIGIIFAYALVRITWKLFTE